MTRQIICLTPVKNEAWILERFLKCASLWADVIIVADQNSTDQSSEIAQSFDKVRFIENKSQTFNEPERQKLLISEARKIKGEKVLIALDADEILTSNFTTSPEWSSALNALPGTVLEFYWANICPDMSQYWLHGHSSPFGFVDDGSPHVGRKIHSYRIPVTETSPTLCLNDIKVMHYQYTDTERLKSKHRWYMAWEWFNGSINSPLELYRTYNHMNALRSIERHNIPKEWFDGYQSHEIDVTSIHRDKLYRWDREVLELMIEHGNMSLKRIPIWDQNWKAKAAKLDFDDLDRFKDPRSYLNTRFHYWLRFTQPNSRSVSVRLVDELLKLIGF